MFDAEFTFLCTGKYCLKCAGIFIILIEILSMWKRLFEILYRQFIVAECIISV